jgi:uncharacterized protein YukE
MGRIRVNTEDIKNKAKDFDSAAEAFKRAGDDILAAAMAMPSYEGQLSGPARKAGYEIQKQTRELSIALAGNAESLRKTAQAFEEVDNQTVKLFEENSILLSGAFRPGGPGGEDGGPIRKAGNHDWLGYYDYGESVIFWKNGESIIITITDENRELIEQYEKAVDDYCKALAEMLSLIQDLVMEYIDSYKIACILVILVCCGAIAWECAAALAPMIGISATQLEKIKKVVDGTLTTLGIVTGATNSDIPDILAKMGFDPIDPWKLNEGISKIQELNEEVVKARNEAAEIYEALAPEPTPNGTPSGPTPIPAPTPPSPTPTETPTPP